MKFTIRLLTLLIAGNLLSTAVNAAGTTPASAESIRFIALPYLHSFHIDRHGQAVFISRDKNRQELAEQLWQVSTTSIANWQKSSGQIQMLDVEHVRGIRIASDQSIIIPTPATVVLTEPLKARAASQTALWLQFSPINAELKWNPPSLLPMAYASFLDEKKRKSRLAEKMADRAFYFGYDENNDALK